MNKPKRKKYFFHAYATEEEKKELHKFIEDMRQLQHGKIRQGDILPAILYTVKNDPDIIQKVRDYMREKK
jgi:hypothetical protein